MNRTGYRFGVSISVVGLCGLLLPSAALAARLMCGPLVAPAHGAHYALTCEVFYVGAALPAGASTTLAIVNGNSTALVWNHIVPADGIEGYQSINQVYTGLPDGSGTMSYICDITTQKVPTNKIRVGMTLETTDLGWNTTSTVSVVCKPPF